MHFLRVTTVSAVLMMILASLTLPDMKTASGQFCTYQGSFLTLYQLAPGWIGDCITNEFTYLSPPGYQQVTQGGLLWSRPDLGEVGFVTTNGSTVLILAGYSYVSVPPGPFSPSIASIRAQLIAAVRPGPVPFPQFGPQYAQSISPYATVTPFGSQ